MIPPLTIWASLARLTSMSKKLLIGAVAVISLLVLASAVYLMLGKKEIIAPTRQEGSKSATPAPGEKGIEEKSIGTTFKQERFDNIKTPHYVSSTPTNNELLTTAPSKVTINFNFNVVPPSKISVTRDEVDVTSGSTTFSSDNLFISVPINGQETGNYKVTYKACWPDDSCHNGSFGFSVKLDE